MVRFQCIGEGLACSESKISIGVDNDGCGETHNSGAVPYAHGARVQKYY